LKKIVSLIIIGVFFSGCVVQEMSKKSFDTMITMVKDVSIHGGITFPELDKEEE